MTHQDLDRALSLARQSVNVRPDVNSLDTLGWVQYRRGEYKDAVASFRRALQAHPDLHAVRYRLGVSLSALGETAEATEILGKLIGGPAFPEIEAARAEFNRIKGS